MSNLFIINLLYYVLLIIFFSFNYYLKKIFQIQIYDSFYIYINKKSLFVKWKSAQIQNCEFIEETYWLRIKKFINKEKKIKQINKNISGFMIIISDK